MHLDIAVDRSARFSVLEHSTQNS